MLNITKKTEDDKVVIELEGAANTVTSQELERQLPYLLEGAVDVVLDLKKLNYITSAGLRVLLQLENTMEERGSMIVVNVSEEVMEIFTVTGFTKVLKIQ